MSPENTIDLRTTPPNALLNQPRPLIDPARGRPDRVRLVDPPKTAVKDSYGESSEI